MVKGAAIAILTYAFMIAWVARLAERRGRIWILWAAIAGVVGAVAIVGGIIFISIVFDEDSSMAAMLLVVLSPLFGMVGSMAAVAGVLVKLPIATSTRRFTLHDMAARGSAGSLAIRDAHMLHARQGAAALGTLYHCTHLRRYPVGIVMSRGTDCSLAFARRQARRESSVHRRSAPS